DGLRVAAAGAALARRRRAPRGARERRAADARRRRGRARPPRRRRARPERPPGPVARRARDRFRAVGARQSRLPRSPAEEDATMADRTLDEQLVKYLTDMHSIEEQALQQLRKAPDIAGDPALARAFEEHLRETERHEELVRERLEAHGANASAVKDLVMRARGAGFLL